MISSPITRYGSRGQATQKPREDQRGALNFFEKSTASGRRTFTPSPARMVMKLSSSAWASFFMNFGYFQPLASR